MRRERQFGGIDITVILNSQTMFSNVVARHYDMSLKGLALKQGDVLSIIVGPDKNATGTDTTNYRIKLYRAS